jgi:PAS domain S-box-containing protein
MPSTLFQRAIRRLFPGGERVEHGFSSAQAAEILGAIYGRGDRIIGNFLVLHALVAVALGFFYQTWTETIGVTLAALAMFFLSAWLVPRSFLTRCIGGISLQIFVALHIYQMHGLAEQHFWFFTAFTMMIVYQDWKSMWPGALLIIGQHILFALLHNSGVKLYFFEDPFIGFTKLFFHFGIALVEVGICGYWAHLLRQQTLSDAWQRTQLRERQHESERQLEIVRHSESELQRVRQALEADVAERRRVEEILRRSEERYRDLFENASDLIQTVNAEGRLLYANRAWLVALGYAADEVSRLALWDIVHPDCREHCANVFERVLAGDCAGDLEASFLAKDGRKIEVEGGLSCRVVQGRVISVRGIFRDVTEKKQLESQMLRSQRLESIGRLAGGIAHDLNNVLAPVTMAAQLLRRKTIDLEDRELLDTMEGSAKRGAAMIKQLLTFARGADGERVPLRIAGLMDDMVRIARDTFPRRIQISVETGKDLWTVRGDATQLHQVLMNLCVNARDAMPHGGTLRMAAGNVQLDEIFVRRHMDARAGAHVRLTVEDSGTGIPRDLLDRIFDPFFTTKEVGKGTGLGLATVLGIVKSHGGFLEVQSEVGRGTVFDLYLPADAGVEVPAAPPVEDEGVHGEGELILVVDDEMSVRNVTRSTLTRSGYHVITAENGAEAVAIFAGRSTEIHAVITDMSMPVMDGPATIRALQRIDPEVKLLAVSGLMEKEKSGPLLRSGTVTLLHKPFSASRLLSTLRAVLAGRRITSNTSFFYEKDSDY